MGYFFGFFLHGAVTLTTWAGWPPRSASASPSPSPSASASSSPAGQGLQRHPALLRWPAPAGWPPWRSSCSTTPTTRAARPPPAPPAGPPQRGRPHDRRPARRSGRGSRRLLGSLLHQRLFDVELALTNIARFAEAMARLDLPADQRARGPAGPARRSSAGADGAEQPRRRACATLLDGEAASRRGADSPRSSSRTASPARSSTWPTPGRLDGLGQAPPTRKRHVPARRSCSSAAGCPARPGSARRPHRAGLRRGDRITLAPYSRTAIQMGVAVGGRHRRWATCSPSAASTGR